MSQKQNERNILFLYECAHIDSCTRFLNENPSTRDEGYLIIPSSLEIEYALTKKGIPFLSGREYRPQDASRFVLDRKWTAEVFDSPQWKWFTYREVALSQLFSLSIVIYTVKLLYYATILENVLIKHPATRRLIVFPSSHSLRAVPLIEVIPSVRQQPLLREQLAAVVACAQLIGAQRGVEVVVPQEPESAKRELINRFVFTFKRALLELWIRIYNVCIALLRPRGTTRILASDYWRSIAPILSQLPKGELMLFDRGEVFKVGLMNLLRFRVRLYNFDSFSIRDRKKIRRETQQLFEKQWHDICKNGLPEFSTGSFSLRPLFVEAFEEILTRVVPQALCDIDSAYVMLKTLAPDAVFLRTTVSLQTHFHILPLVARASGTPSLELQHGLEYIGPSSYSRKGHSSEYLAVYGQLVQDEFAALGFSRENFPIVGSPRFDVYKNKSSIINQNNLEKKGISVLCVGTAVAVESAYDTYDLEDYYCAIAQAIEKIPNSSVIIKLRPGHANESFYREAIDTIFARVPHTIAQYEPLPELFTSADIVVSYYSTFVLEALQFSKPVIVFTAEPGEKEMIRFHFTRYADAGGLIIADTQKELEEALLSLSTDSTLRDKLAKGSKKVLDQFHSFDGKASERIVEFIEKLAQRRK